MSDYRIPSIPDQWPISAEKGAYHHYFNKVMRQNTLKGLPTLRLEAKGLKAWAFRRSVFRYMGHEA